MMGFFFSQKHTDLVLIDESWTHSQQIQIGCQHMAHFTLEHRRQCLHIP